MSLILAEVPEAIAIWADVSRYRQRPQAQGGLYRMVVTHITSGRANPYNVAAMWQKPPEPGKAGTSAHFVIGGGQDTEYNGVLLQCVPLRFAAQHAHDASAYSVGIEHCVREPNEPAFPKGDPGLPPTPELYATSARLSAYLLKAAGLPVIRGQTIEGHNKADPKTTHTGCPDAGPWNWDYYLQLVNAAYAKLNLP